jgi:hypothetical protein
MCWIGRNIGILLAFEDNIPPHTWRDWNPRTRRRRVIGLRIDNRNWNLSECKPLNVCLVSSCLDEDNNSLCVETSPFIAFRFHFACKHSMVQHPFLEANSRSYGQEILCFVWNLKFHYGLHKSRQFYGILRNLNLVYRLTAYFFKIHCTNITLPYSPKISKCFLPFRVFD